MKSAVPALRVTPVNNRPHDATRDIVLYWMIASRRTEWNFALDRAIEWSVHLRKPLVVVEALRAGYEWASDRLHTFVLQGMAENARRLASAGVLYHPYVESRPDEGRGLLSALARTASVVITDDSPAFFLRRMVRAAAAHTDVLVESIDSNGLVPLAGSERAYPTAFAFRRFLQKALPIHLRSLPQADPLRSLAPPVRAGLPAALVERWPAASDALLSGDRTAVSGLPIDHTVGAVATHGGSRSARAALARFVEERLPRYATGRNDVDDPAASGLSPYLHFGHISAHEVFHAVMSHEKWTTRSIAGRASGQREGWWGASANAEAFLDEIVTWRELGYNMCQHRPEDYDRYTSLPEWARSTLDRHRRDRREHVYTLEEFAAGATHDRVWNAAQHEIVRDGRMHNYLRMLWGKKIVEWSASPEDALATMIELNNRYGLDGRDPNSYAGIFWVLGRYDRPWAPERPIFGTVRYMSSDNTLRKLKLRNYLARYA